MKRIKLILVLLIVLTLVFTSCKNKNPKPYTRSLFIMGTVCSITLYEKIDDSIFDEVFKIIEDIDNKMSTVIVNSELYKINSNAGINPVMVSDDTYMVIKESIRYAELVDSKFDITIGPLVNLWGIGTEHQSLPDTMDIESVIPLIGSENIVLNNEEKSIFLKKKGMAVDLGGIAKGYASDMVRNFFIKNGIAMGIINLGGNVLTFGSKAIQTPWRIGIQDPLDTKGRYIGTLDTGATAVVTSGIYERYFEKDGKRYHHILDPDSGYPIENDLLSITIVTDTGISADAYSTVVFSAGLEKGMDIIESNIDIEGIFITKNKKVYITSGLNNIFNLISTDYTLSSM